MTPNKGQAHGPALFDRRPRLHGLRLSRPRRRSGRPSAHRVQKTGTWSWEIALIKERGLDKAADLEIETTELASTDAARVALVGGAADMVVPDWLWAARERGLGDKLLFTPYSSALGAVMAPKDSPVHGLADRAGRSIGIAGAPIDKSRLMLRAAALGAGLDLMKDADDALSASTNRNLGVRMQLWDVRTDCACRGAGGN